MKTYAPSETNLCRSKSYTAVSSRDDCNPSFKLHVFLLLRFNFSFVNKFTVKSEDADEFLKAWEADATYFKSQPGSFQLSSTRE
jgi:hypothetical protein